MVPTEYLSRSSKTVLNLLAMYASTSSLTCGSYSMYIEKESFSNSCDLIAARERLASAQRVPAMPISPGAMSYLDLRTRREDTSAHKGVVPSRPSHLVPLQHPVSERDLPPSRSSLVQAEQWHLQSQVSSAIWPFPGFSWLAQLLE